MSAVGGKIPTLPYDQQLTWVAERVRLLRAQNVTISKRGMENLLMLLSIAESLKQAKACNLNHREAP